MARTENTRRGLMARAFGLASAAAAAPALASGSAAPRPLTWPELSVMLVRMNPVNGLLVAKRAQAAGLKAEECYSILCLPDGRNMPALNFECRRSGKLTTVQPGGVY